MIPCMKNKIPDYLLEKMAIHDWTQQELADKVGVSKGTISRWINQPGDLDVSSMKKIASGSKVPLQEILDVMEGQYTPLSKAERGAIEIRNKYDAEAIGLAFLHDINYTREEL